MAAKARSPGAFAAAGGNVGRDNLADEVSDTFRAAGYTVFEADPFAEPSPFSLPVVRSRRTSDGCACCGPAMRTVVLEHFPTPPVARPELATYLQQVEDVYHADAYHSLSIEGYQVSDALIERVRSGDWNPDHDPADRENRNALAARGYLQAFQRVKAAVERVLMGDNAGVLADRAHPGVVP